MKKSTSEIEWLKRTWLLARCQFKLSESPGFEEHKDELSEFEISVLVFMQTYKDDPTFYMPEFNEETTGVKGIEPFSRDLRRIEEAFHENALYESAESLLEGCGKYNMGPLGVETIENILYRLSKLEESVGKLRFGLYKERSKKPPKKKCSMTGSQSLPKGQSKR